MSEKIVDRKLIRFECACYNLNMLHVWVLLALMMTSSAFGGDNSAFFVYKGNRFQVSVKDAGASIDNLSLNIEIQDRNGKTICSREEPWKLSDFSAEEQLNDVVFYYAEPCAGIPLKMKMFSSYRNETHNFANYNNVRLDRDTKDVYLGFVETETSQLLWEKPISTQTLETRIKYFDLQPISRTSKKK
jgi:hypothetical protein